MYNQAQPFPYPVNELTYRVERLARLIEVLFIGNAHRRDQASAAVASLSCDPDASLPVASEAY